MSESAPASVEGGDVEAPPVVEQADEGEEDIEKMQQRLKEIEDAEMKRLGEGKPASTVTNDSADAGGADLDSRSVYVGSVDYSTTKEELTQLFSACGPVNRVTIMTDKFTGQPKGFAYVEFKDAESLSNAMLLNETEFKGRILKVTAKRTNVPGFNRGRGGAPRGRGGRGRGGGSGYYEPYGYAPVRGRGRGRGRGGYHPYY